MSNFKNKIHIVNNKIEKKNISNNIYPNNKKNQINNTIYNIKKSSINKELTTKLKENEQFYKKIMNENLDSFNYKLIELENKNIILIKKNQALKNEVMDIKNKYNNIKTSFVLSIRPVHEIDFYIIKKNNNFVKIDKGKDENFVKMQKLISQYKLKNFNLNNEINLLKNQIINIKNQFNKRQNKFNEIFNDNKSKEKKILLKEKEIETKKNEICNLNNKLDQLLSSFEKEKKEKEQIIKLNEKYSKEAENNKNEIEKIKSLSLSKDKLKNITSQSHKIILNKNIPKYKLNWFLITIKNENEIKNYLNTFWVSEEEMQQINSKLILDNSYINLNEEKDIDKNNEVIKNLNNIIEEKEKKINQLKNKIEENKNENKNGNSNHNSLDYNDKRGFIIMDKYIKIVNQLNEAKKKINELTSEKSNNKNIFLNQEIKNFNISGISEEFSAFIKNDENMGGSIPRISDENRNNKINMNNSDDTNKYLEKYIDDLENKIENIKNLIQLLIKEMHYTNNIKNTLYNIMIVCGFNDQEAISIIQEKKKSSKNDN